MATLLRGFQISSNQIQAAHLMSDSVTTLKIVDGAITTAKVLDANITTGKLADVAVTTDKIAALAVTAVKIAADAVTTAKILNANVTTAKIADSAIVEGKIGTGAVVESKIGASAVTASKIGDNAVTTSKVLNANITTEKLATGAVTNAVLAADAVDGTKISDDAIASEHIANNAVLTAAIADGAITYAKLEGTVQAKLDNTLSRVVDATTDPTVNDDSVNTSAEAWSYGTAAQVGSIWINTTTDEIFRCMDDAVGAAVWAKTSLNVSELGDLALMDLTTLQTTIQVAAVGQVTGLQAALDLKGDDSTSVKLTGDQSIDGVKTFNEPIQGNLTGNVTGQISDVQNHITTIAEPEPNKFVSGIELSSKFTSVEADIATKADNATVVHLTGVETITGVKTFSAAVVLSSGFTIGAATVDSIENVLRGDGLTSANSVVNEMAIRTALDSLEAVLNSSIALKANDNSVVHLTGNESIGGTKTFTAEAKFNSGFTVAGATISSVQATVRTTGNTSNTAVATEAAVRAAIDSATAQVALSVRKEFTGDNTVNSFTYDSDGGTTSQLLVYRNGQLLRTTADYTDSGSAIAFGSAPEISESIDILRWYTGN